MDISDKQWQDKAEQKLWELVDGVVVAQDKMDKDGCVHELKVKMPPNMDAVKFVLKNRSKGKWADKTEVTHTQVNLNLTASYNEVKGLMEQQKMRVIEQKNAQNLVIEDNLSQND